jgi:hypothetical protein
VYVTEVTDDLRFYAQREDQGSKLVALMDELTQAFVANPPLGGAYVPKKGMQLFYTARKLILFYCSFKYLCLNYLSLKLRLFF